MFKMNKLFGNGEVDEKFKKKEKPIEVKIEHEETTTRDYKKFRPGTAGWMVVWRSYPELQKEMLEYMSHLYIFCPIREHKIAYPVCRKIKEKHACSCNFGYDEDE
jgi:hypothetical protein